VTVSPRWLQVPVNPAANRGIPRIIAGRHPHGKRRINKTLLMAAWFPVAGRREMGKQGGSAEDKAMGWGIEDRRLVRKGRTGRALDYSTGQGTIGGD
jgi:hypothetical protein